MARALSTDLRSRLVEYAKETGDGRIKLSRIFKVGSATAYRWVDEAKKTGSVEPKVPVRKGPLPKIPDAELPALVALVAEKSDRTLQELCDVWSERTGVTVDDATMHRALVRADITRKKRRSAPRSGRGRTS